MEVEKSLCLFDEILDNMFYLLTIEYIRIGVGGKGWDDWENLKAICH